MGDGSRVKKYGVEMLDMVRMVLILREALMNETSVGVAREAKRAADKYVYDLPDELESAALNHVTRFEKVE